MWKWRLYVWAVAGPRFFECETRDEVYAKMGSQQFIDDCRANGATHWEMRNEPVLTPQ